MKILRIILITFLLILFFTFALKAVEEKEETDSIILEQLEDINLTELQEEVDRINSRAGELLPALNIKELVLGFIHGEMELNWKTIITSVIKYLGQEVTANMYLMGQIIILAVISAIFEVFHTSFSSETISKTASLMIFLVLAVIILNSFQLAVEQGVKIIDYMLSFMQALIPVLLTLLVSMGAFTSAAIFHPLTFLLVSALTTGIKTIILPLVFISAVLNIVDNITGEFRISRLASLFKETSLALLGLSMLIIVGGLLLQGGAAAVTDSLSLRTAKYLTGTFIPVLGGMFSDAVDLIVSCSLIIKNALSIFGFIAIIMIIVFPLIKLIALIFIYKLSAALIQPISNERLCNIINEIGNSLILVFLVLLTVVFMFFIVITIIVGAANLTVMMR